MPATRMLLAIAAALSLSAPQHPVTMRHVQPELFATTGALVNALSDIDGDGDADLFVGFNGAPNRLYRNDGGVFVEIGAAAGVADARATRAAAFGDWDADGDPDLLVGFAPGAGPVLRLYRNDGGRFLDATAVADLRVDSGAVRQPVWVDYDADDDLDLFVAFRDRANALFRNTNGRLVDVAAEVGLADARRTVGAVWADLDADGDLDVVVGNMDGDANGVFRNDRGRFTDVAPEWGLAGGGRALGERTSGTVRPCVADMDGDGRFDIITANYGPAGLFLRRDSAWVDAGAQWGIAVDGRYDTCAPADVDNDGRLDLYLNGTVTQGRNWPDYLYRNAGMRFDNAMPDILASIPADHGAQWADLNGDGAVDLALTGQGPHAVLANILPDSVARRSLRVRVLDGRGRATRAGAEVRVYAAGTRRVLATRLVDAGSGYDAQSDLPVHIGLPTSGPVDIEIAWPAAGQRRISRQLGVRVDGRRIVEIRIPSAQDVPAERLAARSKFQDSKFGLFIHWGVYSQMGQGEWVMQNRSIPVDAYEWLASAFNPTKFDAREWVATAKAAGMRYITITARHHDGFSMFASKTSRYNIVDWTPFKRDPLRDLADACRAEGIQLFFYYSQLDWHHTDYWPRGGTGNATGRPDSGTWSRYLDFMDAQLTELLTNYGPIGGIWFDGMWDKPDADWRLERTYALIHRLQPSALIVPNHHKAPLPGEDVQTFEQDLPGSNTAGWNTKEISALPLETSLTMNGAWGFNITDRRFKSTRELVHYLVRAAGAGANLLLNVGPRADGTIQPEAVERLRAMGDWLRVNGTSIYSTRAGPVPPRAWGATTQRGDSVFVHVLDWPDRVLALPNIGARVLSAAMLSDGTRLEFAQSANGVTITLPPATGDAIDRVVVLRIAVASRPPRQ